MMAKNRGVINSGTASLDQLVAAVLRKRMSKDPAIRFSLWGARVLNVSQEKYAAIDVIEPLSVYYALCALPDLSVRLTAQTATSGTIASIVQASGSLVVLGTRVGVGTIKASTNPWNNPIEGGTPRTIGCTAANRVVWITSVLAPACKIPGMQRNGKPMTLGDMGVPPFSLILPLTMLAPFSEARGGLENNTAPISAVVDVAAASGRVVSNRALEQAAIAAVQAAALAVASEETATNEAGLGSDFNAGPDDENGFDELELNEEDVAMMRANEAAVSRGRDALTHEMFFPMPVNIVDKFSSVIGDAFHHMDRARPGQTRSIL
jgi:hypothetical protein